jgi:hypothetical protein
VRLELAAAGAAIAYAAALALAPHPANLPLAAALAGIAAQPSTRPWLSAAIGGGLAYALLLLAAAPPGAALQLLAGILGPLAALAVAYHVVAPALAALAISEARGAFEALRERRRR